MILIVSGDPFTPEDAWNEFANMLDSIHGDNPVTEVVHGGRPGAEALADRWARARNIDLRIFPADFDTDLFMARAASNARIAEYGARPHRVPVLTCIFENTGAANEVHRKMARVNGMYIRILTKKDEQGSDNERGSASHGADDTNSGAPPEA